MYSGYISLSQLLMKVADTIYQHCTVSACLHMHMQTPHEFPKPPLVPGMGMDPAVALGYRLMCVFMCECVKCINVLKSHIYLSNTCDPLSNTPHFLYAHRGSLKWIQRGNFIAVQSLQSFLLSFTAQIYDHHACERDPRNDFTASQCPYWFVKMDYGQYV